MRVLVACEFSGRVRDAFLRRGHDALSVDLLPSESEGPHIQGDVLPLLDEGWDLMLAFPPCTRLCNTGVRWLKERNLWTHMEEAADFFLALWDAPIPRVCVENPIMHGYALNRIGMKYSQKTKPSDFGVPYKKSICLWLRGLPPLVPTARVTPTQSYYHFAPDSKGRWKRRSRTLPEVAEAMASQWGTP